MSKWVKSKSKLYSSEIIRDSSEQTKSEMKELKERLDTLTALLKENKDEGQSQKRLNKEKI